MESPPQALDEPVQAQTPLQEMQLHVAELTRANQVLNQALAHSDMQLMRLRMALTFYANRNHRGYFGLLTENGAVARAALDAGDKHR